MGKYLNKYSIKKTYEEKDALRKLHIISQQKIAVISTLRYCYTFINLQLQRYHFKGLLPTEH